MSHMSHSRAIASCAAVFVAGIMTSMCSSKAAPAANGPELWGDLKPLVSVKELMRDMLDPASDYVFDAVSSVSTKDGVIEKVPKTDEDWDKIRVGAVTL